MTAHLIIAVIITLAGLVTVTNGQFGTKHSNHGMRGDTRCMYCAPGTCNNVTGTCGKCLDGLYGEKCHKTCSNTCTSCDKADGKCTTCMNGWFGANCDQECPQCDMCNKVSGTCTTCKSNNWGDTCQNLCEDGCQRCDVSTGKCQYCASGFYGERCKLPCDYCRQGMCDRDFGKCVYGCDDGLYGEKCEKTCTKNCRVCNQNDGSCIMCDPPLWGEYCESRCPVNCDFCNVTSGDCLECNPGFYGHKCTTECNNCLDGYCQKDTGFCEGTCLDRWFGAKCDKKCRNKCLRCAEKEKCMLCEKGWAGENCDIKCPERCPSCATDMLTGDIMCMECSGEFKIPDKNCSCSNKKCTKIRESAGNGFVCADCAEGWYLREGTCCPCHKCAGGNQFCGRNGNCKNGCEPKYFRATEGCDQYCDIPHCTWCESFYGHGKICKGCDPGFFLSNHGCEPCNSKCKGGSCDQKTGRCLDGCESGRYGDKCDSLCPDKYCPPPVCDVQNCLTCEKSTSPNAKCKECNAGFYVAKGVCTPCSKNCRKSKLKDHTCSSVSGKCFSGCMKGWSGKTCDVRRVNVKICRGHCKLCDAMTGECASCYSGSWGSRCNKICPENCRECDQMTGKCSVICSKNCKRIGSGSPTCDTSTGECLNGCEVGWMGKTCRYRCAENGSCMITRKPIFEAIYFRK